MGWRLFFGQWFMPAKKRRKGRGKKRRGKKKRTRKGKERPRPSLRRLRLRNRRQANERQVTPMAVRTRERKQGCRPRNREDAEDVSPRASVRRGAGWGRSRP
ncbi:hypothetical protein LX36DRAFT_405973 [Colletotrichum falcatum]|nr:hypothetical protein LX36DRAFT_405973 [Colletotrichum falcatum]